MNFASFKDHLDYERLYEAIGFEPLKQDRRGNDVGQCFDLYGLHKHGDRTGKFVIYQEDGKVSCFVCGGMSLPHFVALLRDITDDEAVAWLYQFSGDVEQDDNAFLMEVEKAVTPIRNLRRTLPKFNEGVLDRYTSYGKWPEHAHVWAEERGISPEAADRFMLRFGRIQRIPPKGIEGEPYLGDAIILPHVWRGKLVGWQMRWLDERPKWLGKYVNTSDFPRDHTVYNYDSCCKTDLPVTIVESCTTALFLESNSYPAIATFGAKLNEEQMKLLRRFGQGVILAPDNDMPGRRWLHSLGSYLEDYVPVYEAPVVDGEGSDLGSLAPNVRALNTYMQRLASR